MPREIVRPFYWPQDAEDALQECRIGLLKVLEGVHPTKFA